MRTRHARDERPPTTPPDAPRETRDPVLIGDFIFDTLAELARRTTPDATPHVPSQRTRPHP
ncbi:hypothetical protein [Kitasatospora sp. NPDC005748]|uniref:hypothetical protein n=1 Tax=Kitasatospora sp. NPDC005748 TaxID=3157063 RepID=UPI0033E7FBCB